MKRFVSIGGAAAPALAFVAAIVACAAPVSAHLESGKVAGTCVLQNTAGRATMTVTVANVWSEPVRNLTPSDLLGSRTGSAEFYIQTFPRPLRELLPGKQSSFQWRGRFYGDGLLDVSLEVIVELPGGATESTGIINCNRLAVGNSGPTPTSSSGSVEPTATRTAPAVATATAGRPTRTRIPTATPRPTRTPRPANPTATATLSRPTQTHTRVPPTRTSTALRATRTPVAPRPTRTPIIHPTRTPTRTQPPRPSATATQVRPTSTPTRARPTRTPMPTATPRPTRTPLNANPTATRVPTPGSGPVGPLHATCSLRRNIDLVVVTMVVENRTGAEVRNLSASPLLLAPEGGSVMFDRAGPSPRSVSTLRSGFSASFQWTGRLSPGGTMGFSATAGGTAPGGPVETGLIDCGVSGSGHAGFDPSGFSGTCTIHPGDRGKMVLQVRNGTAEPLSRVEGFLTARSTTGTATVTEVRGPAPRVVATLSSGARRDFAWEARFLGAGDVSLSFEARGDRSTRERISTGEIVCNTTSGPVQGNLPDLSVDQEDLRNSVQITTEHFPANHCAVVEGCLDGVGNRRLLRFNTTTPNHGPGDIFLGDPRQSTDVFEYSACHNHYHFNEFADYRLLDMAGNIVARGHKQAFCLVDLWQPPGSRGRADPQFVHCGFQGISAGWADVYHRGLDCQWVDITGVPSGRYVLEVHVNPTRFIREHNYSNNVARTEITIP